MVVYKRLKENLPTNPNSRDKFPEFMVSPANSPAVLVKIQLGEDPKAPSFVFQFTSDSAKEDQCRANSLTFRTPLIFTVCSCVQRIIIADSTKVSTTTR